MIKQSTKMDKKEFRVKFTAEELKSRPLINQKEILLEPRARMRESRSSQKKPLIEEDSYC